MSAAWRRPGLIGLIILGLVPASAPCGEVYVASAGHQRGIYHVEVDALVSIPEPQVRRLLTDYRHLGRINPAIEHSQILLQRRPGEYRVRTVTLACVWLYCKRVHQVQDVVEAADGSVTATVIPRHSDFHSGYARLDLVPVAGGTRVMIRASVEPDFWIPPFIGPWLIQRKLRSEALETIRNLERVAKLARLPHNNALQPH